MVRIVRRRGRILHGPLKILQQAERRGPLPMAPLALASAAMAAFLLLLPQLAPRVSVDPTPMAESADAGPAMPEARAAVDPAPLVVAATPARAEPGAPEPGGPALGDRAAAPAQPAVDRSLFALDLLPVLQVGGADLDADAAALPKAPPKPSARRAPARTAVTDGTARP